MGSVPQVRLFSLRCALPSSATPLPDLRMMMSNFGHSAITIRSFSFLRTQYEQRLTAAAADERHGRFSANCEANLRCSRLSGMASAEQIIAL